MTNPREVVSGYITNSDGDVLIGKRHKDSYNGGLWEFPGGKLEIGESLADALERELKEELGVEVTDVGPVVHAGQDGIYMISIVHVRIKGTPHNIEGHTEIRWVTIEDLQRMSVAPQYTLTPVNRAYVIKRWAVKDLKHKPIADVQGHGFIW